MCFSECLNFKGNDKNKNILWNLVTFHNVQISALAHFSVCSEFCCSCSWSSKYNFENFKTLRKSSSIIFRPNHSGFSLWYRSTCGSWFRCQKRSRLRSNEKTEVSSLVDPLIDFWVKKNRVSYSALLAHSKRVKVTSNLPARRPIALTSDKHLLLTACPCKWSNK